ncbi:MAG: Mpo1-like protein, partial [Acinetobacter junii]|nr:Mpo1-like protein [Acinetobacter junii]
MKSIDEWFDEYSDSHQNQTNKKIHWVCVPAILFSIIGILAHFSTLLTALLLVLTLVFYARLDIVLAVAMAALLVVMAWLIIILPVGVGFYIGVFVIAWIGQFYSLTLSPALAALLLKPHGAKKDLPTRLIDRLFG